MQAQDIAGEIALAAELLESEDPEEQRAAIDLIEQYLSAAEHTQQLLFSKADNVVNYRSHLLAVADFRRREAERLTRLAEADERRATKLENYLLQVLTTLHPDATKFSLPTHELTSRRSESVEILDPDELPDDLLTTKVVTTTQPDKAAIKAAIKAGQPTPGARLVTKRNWSIK